MSERISLSLPINCTSFSIIWSIARRLTLKVPLPDKTQQKQQLFEWAKSNKTTKNIHTDAHTHAHTRTHTQIRARRCVIPMALICSVFSNTSRGWGPFFGCHVLTAGATPAQLMTVFTGPPNSFLADSSKSATFVFVCVGDKEETKQNEQERGRDRESARVHLCEGGRAH